MVLTTLKRERLNEDIFAFRILVFTARLGLFQHDAPLYELVFYFVKVKKSRALNETPSQSYGVSLAICDHTVEPATLHIEHTP